MNETISSLEPRVARLEGELEQLVVTVNSLVKSTASFQQDLNAKLGQIAKESHPDFSVLAQWAAVMLFVMGMIATPVAYHFNKSIDGLDVKLQKEFELSIKTATQGLENLRMTLNERTEGTLKQIDANHQNVERLRNQRDETIRDELQELRLRRMNSNPRLP